MNDNMLQRSGARSSTTSRLTCAQCERMLFDAADETLLPEDKDQFYKHLAGCEACSRLMADAQRGRAWLGMLYDAPPQPSDDLVQRILSSTSGDASIAIPLRPRNEPILSYAGGGYTIATDTTMRTVPFGPVKRVNWVQRLLASVSQPRFAMTAAMAFFSIALTLNLTGVSLRNLHASSFTPANMRHTFWATNARVFRYYDNLRVVYELESRVREVQRDSDDSAPRSTPAPTPQPVPAPEPTKKAAPAGGAEPRSSLPAHTDSKSHATVDVPSHPHPHTLPSSSLAASAAHTRGEGACA